MITYPHAIKAALSAEVGCNHGGSLKIAQKMILAAKEAGASAVKFQKRTVELLPPEKAGKPYDNPHSFGKTYGEHRAALEFSQEQHAQLWNFCRMEGIQYATSVWDIPAFEAVKGLSAPFLKIPSACNEDLDLIKAVARHWSGEVHISNGMAEPGVEKDWKTLLGDRLVVYVATSSYPNAMGDVNLKDLIRLRQEGFRVGFSGHHLGIALDVAAAVLGAEWIERHFTLDRAAKGTDHAASLEPDGLRKLCRDVQAVHEAWNVRRGILPCEQEPRKKLKVG